MRVGLFLTNEHATPGDLIQSIPAQLELARTAADAGWDSIFTGQHFVTEGTQRLQPLPFLARLAAEVPGLTLGTGIHLWSLGNPVAMAEEFATLDVITGGRTVAGLGLGYRDEEFAAFGIDKSTRVRRFERNLQIARSLWRGDAVTANEQWCRLDEATAGTPTVTGDIPVWIGGTSDNAVRRAGRLADGWMLNPAAPRDTVARQASLYRSVSSEHGRGRGHIAAFREIFCAPTTADAQELALPYLHAKYKAYGRWGQQEGHPTDGGRRWEDASMQTHDFIVGDPEHCRVELSRFRDEVGVDEFILRTDWPGMPKDVAQSSIGLLSREVLPAL